MSARSTTHDTFAIERRYPASPSGTHDLLDSLEKELRRESANV